MLSLVRYVIHNMFFNMNKKSILLTAVFFSIAFMAYSVSTSCSTQPAAAGRDTIITDTLPEEHQLSLLIAGDLMQHGPQIKAARQRDGSYNYDECFARVKPEIEKCDVAIANFEVTLGGKPYSGYPRFSAPDEYLQAVKDAGFDILLTANNHCLDTRRQGLERTIMMMDSLRIPHLGTYVDREEHDRHYPFLLERNGMRIVLLNFTYDTNGIAIEQPNVVNLMDTTEIARDLLKAKALEPDVIIALPHWGIEYQQLPSEEQQAMADWLLSHGVDHVVGGHPHVVQPVELRNDGRNLVAWSLGNVISNQYMPNTYGGCMVRLQLTKRGDVTTLSHSDYLLYWVSRPHDNNHQHQYRILSVDEPDSVLTPRERKQRDTIRQSMRSLMEKHSKGGIREYAF